MKFELKTASLDAAEIKEQLRSLRERVTEMERIAFYLYFKYHRAAGARDALRRTR